MIETPFGAYRHGRLAGEVLHPDRESLETRMGIRRNLGEHDFAGQYQQSPAPAGGGMVKETCFRRYEPQQRPEKFEQIVLSLDSANKTSELSDFSAFTIWGLKGKDIYLLHVLRKRLEYPDLKRTLQEQAQAYKATVGLIEDKASGTQLIQDLHRDSVRGVTGFKPETDKVMRMHALTATIENGFVYIPTEAPWLREYLHELAVFPKGRYDDQVDSTSQALAWINEAVREPAIVQYYREEVEKTRGKEFVERIKREIAE